MVYITFPPATNCSGSRLGTKLIKKILDVLQKYTVKAQELVDLASKASDKMEEIIASGKKAMDAVKKFTKENIVEIHQICFRTSLSKKPFPTYHLF